MKVSFVSLALIGFGVWLLFAGSRYRETYAQATETWRLGSTRLVEIFLQPQDINNLGCASFQTVEGLSCGYRPDRRPFGTPSPSDPKLLQPYNTVGNELFLGAGLWSSLKVKSPAELPHHSFTAVCNYHIEGVGRSVSIRFRANDSFNPVGKTVTAGTLTDCMIPR